MSTLAEKAKVTDSESNSVKKSELPTLLEVTSAKSSVSNDLKGSPNTKQNGTGTAQKSTPNKIKLKSSNVGAWEAWGSSAQRPQTASACTVDCDGLGPSRTNYKDFSPKRDGINSDKTKKLPPINVTQEQLQQTSGSQTDDISESKERPVQKAETAPISVECPESNNVTPVIGITHVLTVASGKDVDVNELLGVEADDTQTETITDGENLNKQNLKGEIGAAEVTNDSEKGGQTDVIESKEPQAQKTNDSTSKEDIVTDESGSNVSDKNTKIQKSDKSTKKSTEPFDANGSSESAATKLKEKPKHSQDRLSANIKNTRGDSERPTSAQSETSGRKSVITLAQTMNNVAKGVKKMKSNNRKNSKTGTDQGSPSATLSDKQTVAKTESNLELDDTNNNTTLKNLNVTNNLDIDDDDDEDIPALNRHPSQRFIPGRSNAANSSPNPLKPRRRGSTTLLSSPNAIANGTSTNENYNNNNNTSNSLSLNNLSRRRRSSAGSHSAIPSDAGGTPRSRPGSARGPGTGSKSLSNQNRSSVPKKIKWPLGPGSSFKENSPNGELEQELLEKSKIGGPKNEWWVVQACTRFGKDLIHSNWGGGFVRGSILGAADAGNLEIVKLLLAFGGKDLLNHQDIKGRSVQDICVKKWNLDLENMLGSNHESLKTDYWNFRALNGYEEMQILCRSRSRSRSVSRAGSGAATPVNDNDIDSAQPSPVTSVRRNIDSGVQNQNQIVNTEGLDDSPSLGKPNGSASSIKKLNLEAELITDSDANREKRSKSKERSRVSARGSGSDVKHDAESKEKKDDNTK